MDVCLLIDTDLKKLCPLLSKSILKLSQSSGVLQTFISATDNSKIKVFLPPYWLFSLAWVGFEQWTLCFFPLWKLNICVFVLLSLSNVCSSSSAHLMSFPSSHLHISPSPPNLMWWTTYSRLHSRHSPCAGTAGYIKVSVGEVVRAANGDHLPADLIILSSRSGTAPVCMWAGWEGSRGCTGGENLLP